MTRAQVLRDSAARLEQAAWQARRAARVEETFGGGSERIVPSVRTTTATALELLELLEEAEPAAPELEEGEIPRYWLELVA